MTRIGVRLGAGMRWQRVVLGVHVLSILVACSLEGWAYLFVPRVPVTFETRSTVGLAVSEFAAAGFLAGLALMAGRSRQSESLALAFSTVAALLLLLLAVPVQ